MSEVEGNVFFVSKEVILRHERVLIKQMVLISSEHELIQGPLDQFPRKGVNTPQFAGHDRVKDESMMAYAMLEKDPLGEKKISVTGHLHGGRCYLFNTFTLIKSSHLFVLVSDLINTIQFEGSEGAFSEKYDQFMPLELLKDEENFLVKEGLLSSPGSDAKYITARSAFVQFGAAVIASGTRILDDYWENIAKQQGLTPHHRVFKLSNKLIQTLKSLKPSLFPTVTRAKMITGKDGKFFESPFLTVTEQVVPEIRQEYGREFSQGQHIGVVVPGQSINGSLELSAQFKVPKYHSKNSFQQATQYKALDTPIGMQQPPTGVNYGLSATGSRSISSVPSSTHINKPGKRLLSNILDTGINTIKSKKSEEHELISASNGNVSTNETLNINGWKFESLPLRSSELSATSHHSVRGLPFYEKEKLLNRLKSLTPNQVKEVEHLHDSVFLNTGLQNVRKVRLKKWTKYWQYKSGVPVGLRGNEIELFKNQYLKDILEQTSSVTKLNEATYMDETHITTRVPNANFLGNSNIRSFKPPYVSEPN